MCTKNYVKDGMAPIEEYQHEPASPISLCQDVPPRSPQLMFHSFVMP